MRNEEGILRGWRGGWDRGKTIIESNKAHVGVTGRKKGTSGRGREQEKWEGTVEKDD